MRWRGEFGNKEGKHKEQGYGDEDGDMENRNVGKGEGRVQETQDSGEEGEGDEGEGDEGDMGMGKGKGDMGKQNIAMGMVNIAVSLLESKNQLRQVDWDNVRVPVQSASVGGQFVGQRGCQFVGKGENSVEHDS